MKNKISITEEDLFKFVYYRDELPQDKQKYLEENEKLFSEEIEFIKSFSEKNDKQLQSKKLDKAFNIFTLFPEKNNRRDTSKKLKLAAASETLKKNIETISFSDPESNYIIRQVKQKDKNELFIFPKEEDKTKKISFTLYPANLKYYSQKASGSFELPIDISIEQISIIEEEAT